MINKRELFYVLLLAVISVLLLIFFPLIDLEFSESVYNYRVWAEWTLRCAPLPGLLASFLLSVRLTTFSVLRTAARKEDTQTPLQMIVAVVSVLFLPIFTFWRIMYFFDLSVDLVGWIMVFVVIIFSVSASYFRNRDITSKNRRILSSRALTGILLFYVLAGCLLIVSEIWNRVSYQMLVSVGTTEYFTPWFRVSASGLLKELTGQRLTAGSFPCLSVGLAGSAAVFTYFGDGTNRRVRNTGFVISFIYQLFIAVLAVMNGQCYVTDAAFSILFCAIVFVLGETVLHLLHPEDYGNMYELINGLD